MSANPFSGWRGQPWSKKGIRAFWLTLILILLSISATTLYYKGLQASSPFSSNILVLTLINVNFILVILLTLLLSRNLIKLFFERRHQRLGTGFRTKLTVAFVGLSLIPSILLFVVASGLLTSAVESWFGIQVERSLKSSLDVAQTVYREHQASILTHGHTVARAIVRQEWWHPEVRSDLESFLAAETASGNRLAMWFFPPTARPGLRGAWEGPPTRVASTSARARFDAPPDDLFLGSGKTERTLLSSTEGGDAVWGAVPVIDRDGTPLGTLVIESLIPSELVATLEGISSAFEEYSQLKTFKNPIKGGYVLSFLVITLLIIFSATWFGFYVARGITVPIQKLAEGTQAVAQGNLDFKIDVEASDELRVLVDSFNTMTHDIRISKEQLIKAQKAAAWQEVAQRIAHEIKNPLTPILLSAQRLRKKAAEQAPDLRAVVDEATTAIINEVTSLKTLVDEFSTFARMPVPQPHMLDLHDVLRDVIHLYQPAYREVRIHQAFAADLPPAYADRDQMKRVFTNLFENAIEAVSKHGEVWVSTSAIGSPERICVEVSDNGPGIDPSDREKLFLPYFSKKKSGTGLGLAIVQRIISDHNGRINVTERQPHGTTFRIELPVLSLRMAMTQQR